MCFVPVNFYLHKWYASDFMGASIVLLMLQVLGFFFTPVPGLFWPFHYGTGSLVGQWCSVVAWRIVPCIFLHDFRCHALLLCNLVPLLIFRILDCHPLWSSFSACSSISTVLTYLLFHVRSPPCVESTLLFFTSVDT